jgi:hypothetical protein
VRTTLLAFVAPSRLTAQFPFLGMTWYLVGSDLVVLNCLLIELFEEELRDEELDDEELLLDDEELFEEDLFGVLILVPPLTK